MPALKSTNCSRQATVQCIWDTLNSRLLIGAALALQYVVSFALNQAGSVLYFLALADAQISLAVPVTNSLTFIFTGLAGKVLGERFGSKGMSHASMPPRITPVVSPDFNVTCAESYIGVALVVVGVGLCVHSKLVA